MTDTDHLGRPIVAITGTGIATSLGLGKEANWKALTAGVSGIHEITRFSIAGMRTTVAGTIDYLDMEDSSAPAMAEKLAGLVTEEALAESGIGTPGDFPGPLFMALPPVEIEWPHRRALAAAAGVNEGLSYTDLIRAGENGDFAAWYDRFLFGSVGETLAARFGTKGSPIATSTACASGGTAIQLGVEAIRRGECQAALVVGTDASVNPESLIRFSLLSALSTRNDPTAARPFSKDRDGFGMAEGAGALVLESLAHARARGATILGILEGCGEAADGFHRTRSSPDGKPIVACMQRALADSGLTPDQIGYVNAHGTGTPENDKMEYVGIAAVFGDRVASLPVSSNKSMIGHTLTAAGAIEAIFTLYTIRNGVLPPTINYETPDPTLPVDCVPNVARPAKVSHAISNSFGFGGQNVCIVVGAAPE